MLTDKLSPILELTNDVDESMIIAYEYFQTHIADRTKRPALFDKEVYIECSETIDDKPVGFWHMVSIEERHKFPKLLPCTNDPCIALCAQNCNEGTKQVTIKYGSETRNLCPYRASKLPWILDIIKLANRDEASVKVWLKPGNKSASDKLYLRYNKYGYDYVLIFSVQRKFYRLISSFPVFYLSEKQELDEEYKQYEWSYFSK